MVDILTMLRRAIVENVLGQHPDLGVEGFRIWDDYHRSDCRPSDDWPSEEDWFLEGRSVLTNEIGIHHINTACVILRTAIQVCPERLTNIDSDKLNRFITVRSYQNGWPTFFLTGAGITAAIICGLEVVRKENSRNATIFFVPNSQVS